MGEFSAVLRYQNVARAREAMKAKVSVKNFYFISPEVREKGGGNSCTGMISGNDSTWASVYEALAETTWWSQGKGAKHGGRERAGIIASVKSREGTKDSGRGR